jgi:DNA polymerase I-like protein with 3'-5' exonuclease and polymerase domains
MNFIKGNNINISPEEAMMQINESTRDHGIYIDLDRAIVAYTAAMELRRPLLETMRKLAGTKEISVDSRDFVRLYHERFGVASTYLMSGGKLSADKNVRKALAENTRIPDIARRFAKIHQKAAEYNTICKAMKSYLSADLQILESFEGNRMVQVRPEYRVLSTGRLQTRNPNVQNIARAIPDLITYPANYTLLRCDSEQIEPRIMYSHYIRDELIFKLIQIYNDAYFGLLHYITLTHKEEAAARADLNSVEKKPFTKEERQALKLAGLAAGYGSNLEGKDVPYAQIYVEKINNHPMRKAWESQVRKYVRDGGTSFTTAFGLQIIPEETEKYKKTSPGWVEHLIRCGINNPIQGTASQLMFVSVGAAYKVLMNKLSRICYYKHDEGAFYIHDSEKDLIEELKHVTGYTITYIDPKTKEEREWLPIGSDYLIGKKEGSGFGLRTLAEEANTNVDDLLEDYA